MPGPRPQPRRQSPKQPPQSDQPVKQPTSRKPGAELKRLDVFVGKWKLDGEAFGSPFGPAAKVSGEQSWEWLPGGFFLVHRLEGKLGDSDMACIEVIEYDAENGSYPLHSFYNDGLSNEWQARERDGAWTFTGTWERDGEISKVRCTASFNESRDTMTAKWEYAGDGSPWKTFWDTTSTRG